MKPAALLHVLVEDAAAFHVAETKLTQVELRESGEKKGNQKPAVRNQTQFKRMMQISCMSKNEKTQIYLLYSCGYGDEYHVWISNLPNSMTDGHRIWGSGGPVTPTFCEGEKVGVETDTLKRVS